MTKKLLTAERLRKLLDYDPLTGVLTWRERRGGSANKGSRCAYVGLSGYIQITVDLGNYRGHVLAWLHYYGQHPGAPLDHINGAKDDNRIVNLRLSSKSLNAQNLRVANKNNKTGVLGVSKTKNGLFYAQLKVDGKHVLAERFLSLDEAKEGYLSAEGQHHKGCTI